MNFDEGETGGGGGVERINGHCGRKTWGQAGELAPSDGVQVQMLCVRPNDRRGALCAAFGEVHWHRTDGQVIDRESGKSRA